MQCKNIFTVKPYFKHIYKKIYEEVNFRLKQFPASGIILEIGSGQHGFIKEVNNQIVTSDVVKYKNCDLQTNAEHLPFCDESLSAIVGIQVLHHIHNIRTFFTEANRTLKKDGGLVLIEPYWSPVSVLLHTHYHPEPFNTHISYESAISNNEVNQAVSYILFKKYRNRFFTEFDSFKLIESKKMPFIEYLASGGFYRKAIICPSLLPVCRFLDKVLSPMKNIFAIHQILVLKKVK